MTTRCMSIDTKVTHYSTRTLQQQESKCAWDFVCNQKLNQRRQRKMKPQEWINQNENNVRLNSKSVFFFVLFHLFLHISQKEHCFEATAPHFLILFLCVFVCAFTYFSSSVFFFDLNVCCFGCNINFPFKCFTLFNSIINLRDVFCAFFYV